jgi:hypothetical protein
LEKRTNVVLLAPTRTQEPELATLAEAAVAPSLRGISWSSILSSLDKPMISIVAGLNVSFDKLQELMPSQLSLFNYVHDRGLVDLFVKRYHRASAINMSQENMTAFLSNRDEAHLSQGLDDFFS